MHSTKAPCSPARAPQHHPGTRPSHLGDTPPGVALGRLARMEAPITSHPSDLGRCLAEEAFTQTRWTKTNICSYVSLTLNDKRDSDW